MEEIQFSTPEEMFDAARKQQYEGKKAEAEALYRQIVATWPDHPGALLQIGVLMCESRRDEEAEGYIRRSLMYDPLHASTWTALGACLGALGRFDECLEALNRALVLAPGQPVAQFNRGIYRLLMGDWGGWQDYEAGRAMHRLRPTRFARPQWNGNAFEGVLYVWQEQGIGDVINFAQLLKPIRERCPNMSVVLELRRELVPLFEGFAYADALVCQPADQHAPIEFDQHISLMSLPSVFTKREWEKLPAATEYLKADAAKAAVWADIVKSDKFKVGVCWAGSKTHVNDHNRSMAFEQMRMLFDVPGVQFYGLQKGSTEEAENFENLASYLNNWTDTAAAIANLDLVITVDTAVAHLAGAMGKRVWILLPFVPDFRWGLKNYFTPWYPSASLYQQGEPRNWESVVKAAKQDLRLAAEPKVKPIAEDPRTIRIVTSADESSNPRQIQTLNEYLQRQAGSNPQQHVLVKPDTAVLIQHGTGQHETLLNLTHQRHLDYCNRHNIGFVTTSQEVNTEGRKQYWAKVALLRNALNAGNEFVIWMDADVLIVGDEDPRKAVLPGKIGGVYCRAGNPDDPEDGWPAGCQDHINCGVLYVWNTPETRAFVERWWCTSDEGHGWQDQHAFNKIANSPVVQEISAKWNSIEPFFTHPNPVVRAWHGFGTVKQRYDAMEKVLAEVKP